MASSLVFLSSSYPDPKSIPRVQRQQPQQRTVPVNSGLIRVRDPNHCRLINVRNFGPDTPIEPKLEFGPIV